MTRLAVGFGRGFPRSWLFPIGALTLLLGVAATGRLSRSIVADLIAWSPVWLGIALAAYFLRERKVGQLRVAGVIPLIALLFVGLFTWGHLAGWSIMPSAAQRLVGPETAAFTEATLQAEIDGAIEVSGGSEFLYTVEPVMRGGAFGIPGASEQVADTSVSVVLAPIEDPGLYTYAGWDIGLAAAPRWSLVLGGAIDADLTTLAVSGLSIDGSGVVRLGEPLGETPVTVTGSFQIVVPPDTQARVVGVASVPSNWGLNDQGAVSPAGGDGWVIAAGPETSLTVVQG